MSNNSHNIIFSLEEKTKETDNSNEIEKMLLEMGFVEDIDYELKSNLIENLNANANKKYNYDYGINEDFYRLDQCTIKDLLKICSYYDIEKHVKFAKCKKQDIIYSIVYFESLQENSTIVLNRHRMWSYISELMMDSKMKKYIIW